MFWKGLFGSCITAFVLTVGCPLTIAGPPPARDLTGSGATTPAPLYQQWFQEYQARKGVRVSYQATGSGGGIRAITGRAVDFGASDRPMTEAEMRAAPGIVHLPMVAHAIVLVYNLPGVRRRLRLTGPLIADIYLGRVTRWDDPQIARINPGLALPALPILPVHQSGGNAPTSILTDYLSAVSPAWKSRMGAGIPAHWPVGMGGKGCPGVASIVRQSPGGFGYMEHIVAVQNQIPFAAVRNRQGRFIDPTVTSSAVAAGAVDLSADLSGSIVNSPAPTGYPILGYTYLLVYNGGTDPRLKALLTWMLTDGQREAPSLDYVPLPSGLRERVLGLVTRLSGP